MTRNDFTLGFEIEGIYRNVSASSGYGMQSARKINDFWSSSSDSSLDSDKIETEQEWCEECDSDCCGCYEAQQIGEWEAVEMISEVLNTKNYLTALKEFQELVQSGDNELDEDLEFNNSCGCHIHFALRNKNTHNEISLQMVDKFHKVFQQKVKTSMKLGTISTKAGNKILERYYRGYAPKNDSRRGRNSLHWSDEWGTVEWRSFNLTGVTKWKEFYKLFEIAIKTIDKVISERYMLKPIEISY